MIWRISVNSWLTEIAAALLAGCFVMIVHEFPKALMTYRLDKKLYRRHLFQLRELFRFWEYLDGLGLFFSVVGKAGFSRPYLIRLRERRGNLIVGTTGFLSLLLQFFFAIAVLRFGFETNKTVAISASASFFVQFAQLFFLYLAMLSFGMLLTNLFPMSTNDMALIIAGISPDRFLPLVKMDYMTKAVWIFLQLMQLIPTIGMYLITDLL